MLSNTIYAKYDLTESNSPDNKPQSPSGALAERVAALNTTDTLTNAYVS